VTIGRIALLLVLYSASAAFIWAGCKSDCKEEFQSEIETCHLTYDRPEDADDLKMCIDAAKEQYDDCIRECDE
jgi:hypothetical protein